MTVRAEVRPDLLPVAGLVAAVSGAPVLFRSTAGPGGCVLPLSGRFRRLGFGLVRFCRMPFACVRLQRGGGGRLFGFEDADQPPEGASGQQLVGGGRAKRLAAVTVGYTCH